MEQILKIAGFMVDSFVHIWPYLLITIPLAVAVQLTGAAKIINNVFSKKPLVAIFLATVVGAFSPFCSCGVIPVISSLLIGGVPIAPVMSFWIASPSMDPEIFFLSTSVIGLKLSVWRLVSTSMISLLSGYITHFAFQKGILGKEILRDSPMTFGKKPAQKVVEVQLVPINKMGKYANINCCVTVEEISFPQKPLQPVGEIACGCGKIETPVVSFKKRLLLETWKASAMVAKFMALAFFVNALINFYVPQDTISNLLGRTGTFSVVMAALIGVPVYTSNMTALPLISGLLSLGMNKGAALAFLISGPTTTLPAMVAVWGIVRRKIFFLYISFVLVGAIVFGLLFNLIN